MYSVKYAPNVLKSVYRNVKINFKIEMVQWVISIDEN